jgi:membrane protein DedA with SNARE-associated domain
VTDDELAEVLEPAPPVPRTGPIWLAGFVVLVVCTQVANATWAAWTKPGSGHPAALLWLSSRNRYLIATVSSGISPWTWAIVATARMAAMAIVCHMVGRCYGDRALRLFWRYMGMPAEQVSKFENAFAKAEIAVVPFFVGSNIVWVLSGAAATTWKRLVPLFAVGMAARLGLMWWLGKVFEEEVTSFLGWVDRYQLWFIVGSVLIVVLANVRNFRKAG